MYQDAPQSTDKSPAFKKTEPSFESPPIIIDRAAQELFVQANKLYNKLAGLTLCNDLEEKNPLSPDELRKQYEKELDALYKEPSEYAYAQYQKMSEFFRGLSREDLKIIKDFSCALKHNDPKKIYQIIDSYKGEREHFLKLLIAIRLETKRQETEQATEKKESSDRKDFDAKPKENEEEKKPPTTEELRKRFKENFDKDYQNFSEGLKWEFLSMRISPSEYFDQLQRLKNSESAAKQIDNFLGNLTKEDLKTVSDFSKALKSDDLKEIEKIIKSYERNCEHFLGLLTAIELEMQRQGTNKKYQFLHVRRDSNTVTIGLLDLSQGIDADGGSLGPIRGFGPRAYIYFPITLTDKEKAPK